VAGLYISVPAPVIDKPEKELKEFAKTTLLQPDQSKDISLPVTADDLASFQTKQISWIADPGTCTIRTGASSRDFKFKGQFSPDHLILVEKDDAVMSPPN
jgi:beta-glucosidase